MKKYHSNKYFLKAINVAKYLINNKEKLGVITDLAKNKLNNSKDRNNISKLIIKKINTLIMMIRDYISGKYNDIEIKKMVLAIAAIIYFVIPLDLLPDFIPVTGFLDDFTVIVWVFNYLNSELEKYSKWERSN